MDIQTFLTNIGLFLNSTVLPFIIAIAFVAFIWNAFRYFILGGANPSEQEKARTLALWGVLAFVLLLSLWGIVNLLVSGFGLGSRNGVQPDYIDARNFNYSNEGNNYPASNNNPNYGNEGNNYPPSTNNPGYSNEGNNYPGSNP